MSPALAGVFLTTGLLGKSTAALKGTDMDMKVDLVYSHYAMLC